MAAGGGLFSFSAKTTVISMTPLSCRYGWLRGHWTISSLLRKNRVARRGKWRRNWKETHRDSPLASIRNAGNIWIVLVCLQLESICMEVVYKCEVLFYCFQNQQTEEKTIKERSGRVALWTLHKINVGFQGSILAAKEIIHSANIFSSCCKWRTSTVACCLITSNVSQVHSILKSVMTWSLWLDILLQLVIFGCSVSPLIP